MRTRYSGMQRRAGRAGRPSSAVVALLSLAVTTACVGKQSREGANKAARAGEPRTPDGGQEAEEPAPSREPERASAPRERGPRTPDFLEIEGFLPAPLLVPEGAPPKGGFPVLVIAHGAGGRGEHHCQFWDPAIPREWIIVCPQGALLDRRDPEGGAYYPDHFKLRAELAALTRALKERFPGKLKKSYRYMGYSQGATMGALAVVGEMAEFEELVLIEGGGESWSPSRVKAFASTGGRRVILACGTRGCHKNSERAAPAFSSAGVPLDVVNAPGAGHTYGGAVGQLTFEALVEWDRTSGSEDAVVSQEVDARRKRPE